MDNDGRCSHNKPDHHPFPFPKELSLPLEVVLLFWEREGMVVMTIFEERGFANSWRVEAGHLPRQHAFGAGQATRQEDGQEAPIIEDLRQEDGQEATIIEDLGYQFFDVQATKRMPGVNFSMYRPPSACPVLKKRVVGKSHENLKRKGSRASFLF